MSLPIATVKARIVRASTADAPTIVDAMIVSSFSFFAP